MRCKVIVNPNAGRRQLQKNLENILGKLALEQGCSQIDIFRTVGFDCARKEAAKLEKGQYDFVIGCGGDGTLNEVVNGLMASDSRIPLALLPAGTANDFGNYMRLPTDPVGFCQMIADFTLHEIDLGVANGRYFVNVAAFGMFADIPYKTKNRDKSILGKLAYYLRGLSDIPEQLFKTMDLYIEYGEEKQHKEGLLCIVSNSPTVGSMRRLLPRAKVDDGLLDMLLITKPERMALDALFDTLINGDPFSVGAIHQAQISEARFSVTDGKDIELDLDGEHCGTLPLHVKVAPKALQLLVPQNSLIQR